jgi:hypothetical protein
MAALRGPACGRMGCRTSNGACCACCASTRDPGGWRPGAWRSEAYLLGPSLTGMLARMEKSGLVSARAAARRTPAAAVVAATPKGLALADALSASIQAQYADLGRKPTWARPACASSTPCWMN